MYKSVRIQNFRGFEDLTVDRLTPINLFVGDNGVGKTSLVEAIFALAARGNPAVLFRADRWRNLPPRFDRMATAFRWQFRDGDATAVIEIEGAVAQSHGDGWSTECIRFELRQSPGQTIALSEDREEETDSQQETLSDDSILVTFTDSATSATYRGEARIRSRPERPGSVEIALEPRPLPAQKAVFLSVASLLGASEDTNRLTALERLKGESKIHEALRVVQPGLIDVRVGTEGGKHIQADVGGPERIPVGLLGGGFTRLLSMAFAGAAIDSHIDWMLGQLSCLKQPQEQVELVVSLDKKNSRMLFNERRSDVPRGRHQRTSKPSSSAVPRSS